jgi:hypothetical protein
MTVKQYVKQYTRCHRCGRIMFPAKDGRLPPHKLPEGQGALTGPLRPWCAQ